ncbi:hypothetical protein [Methylobacterium nigriterrae]|uniref:hypothetical protein n=1 Tax=Methylobacterium nigriterrae TaxID=3127512 RepID=UPI003013A613
MTVMISDPASGWPRTSVPLLSCPFVQRLISILSEDLSDSPRRQDELLLKLLLALEMEAENCDAPDASVNMIARVRRLAGMAACRAAQSGHAP